jgi:hypothetical protein
MRAPVLLLGLCLAGCAVPTAAVAPDGASASASPSAALPPAASPSAATAAPAAPAAAAQAAAHSEPTPALSEAELLTQARVDCWAKVERAKIARDIDRRIAFVDKCVADAMKAASGK